METDRTYLPLPVAARRLGISEYGIRRRIQRGDLRAYADPIDKRRSLVAADELEAFLRPAPIERRRRGSGMAPSPAAA